MYSPVQLALKYVRYYLTSSNGKGHGVHSPFVFEFITKVLNDERNFYCYDEIEAERQNLIYNDEEILVEDFGAGSRLQLHKKRKISVIAKSSLKPKKYSRLLFRMVNYYQPLTIIELGTSFGITSSYLASGNKNAQLITMEGANEIANVAQQTFKRLNIDNIQIIRGDFTNTINTTLNSLQKIDFAFIDGNHRKEPTIDYFEKLLSKIDESSVLIFDDIHWSSEMEEAWRYIQQNKNVTLTIDLFFIGIVFFRQEQKTKEHFSIRF